jgi:imidazole glycerol phosphate synthase subunit HisF
MNKIRIIARLDIKNEYVIKGIQLEGLRKVGNPNELAKKWQAWAEKNNVLPLDGRGWNIRVNSDINKQ